MTENVNNEDVEEVEDVETPYGVQSFAVSGKAILAILAIALCFVGGYIANAILTPGNPSEAAVGQKIAQTYDPNKSWVSQDQAPAQPSAPDQGATVEQAQPSQSQEESVSQDDTPSQGDVPELLLNHPVKFYLSNQNCYLTLEFDQGNTVIITDEFLPVKAGFVRAPVKVDSSGQMTFVESVDCTNYKIEVHYTANLGGHTLSVQSRWFDIRNGKTTSLGDVFGPLSGIVSTN